MDHLLKKRVGINADDAEDSEVEPLVPMSGGKIAVHPQLIGMDPVVPVNGAGTLVICCSHLWLGDLNNDLLDWSSTPTSEMSEVLPVVVPFFVVGAVDGNDVAVDASSVAAAEAATGVAFFLFFFVLVVA